MRCRVCRRSMVIRSVLPVPADAVVHCARGLCKACYAAQHRRGALDAFPRVRSIDARRQAFLRDYRRLERLGWSMAEIADGLGMSPNLVRQLRHRYGLAKKQVNRAPKVVLEDAEIQRLRRLVGLV